MRTFLPVLLALLLLAPAAFADDDSLSPETFLRRARVLATVERDVEGLRDLVTRAIDKHASDSEWLGAWLEVADTLEKSGQSGDAMFVLGVVTKEHTRALTEAQKNAVHGAMLRLLPPGASATSPLGRIYKVEADAAAVRESPLERKIRDLFEKLTVASVQDQNAINRARQQIVWALRDAGPEVYPILGRIIVEGQPEQARYAAETLADFAKLEALPHFDRALLSGDGMARSASLRGYRKLEISREISPDLVPHLEALIDGAAPVESHATLAGVIRRHLSIADLLERYRKGGDGALDWLHAALDRDEESREALLAAIDHAKRHQEGRESLINTIGRELSGTNYQNRLYRELSGDEARDVMRLMARVPAAKNNQNAFHMVRLAEHLKELDPTESVDEILRPAWVDITVEGHPQWGGNNVKSHVQTLLQHGYLPPSELFGDADWRAAFFRAVAQTDMNRLEAVMELPEFWPAVYDVLPDLEPAMRRQLLMVFRPKFDPLGYPEPLAGDRSWGAALEFEPFTSDPRNIAHYVLRAAGAEGDERVLEFFERAMARADWNNYGSWILQALKTYAGPGLLEFGEGRLRGFEDVYNVNEATSLVDVLAARGAPGHDLLVEIASDYTLPVAPFVVGKLGWGKLDDTRDALKSIYATAFERYDDVPEKYITAVIDAAKRFLHRESVPLLLKAYRNQVKSAAGALDAIHEYNERLKAFEGWAGDSEELDPDTQRLLQLLGDKNPEKRRVAALALAALGVKDRTVVRNLTLVATEDDVEEVRDAALQALEKLAK